MRDRGGKNRRWGWPSWNSLWFLGSFTLISGLPALGQDSAGSRVLGANLAANDAPAPTVNSGVRYNGIPTPGSRITIGFERTDEVGTTYLWKQVEGPNVPIDDPTRPSIRLVVPANAEQLAFAVTVKSPTGDRNLRVVVPIRRSEPPSVTTGPTANAGDDQIGLVGHRITLNGSLSSNTMDQAIGYRWIQMSGPKIASNPATGPYYSFTPSSPGIYRFLLIVAANNTISEPDEVEVTVGEAPIDATAGSRDQAVPSSLATLIDRAILLSGSITGRSVGVSTADVLGSIADRVELYSDFGSLASEQMRRLDAIIPKDPAARTCWQQVFGLVSEQIVADLIQLGLDLRQPQAFQQPLTKVQKDRIKTLFRAYAKEFHSRAQGR